jgi:hypothetical protein
VWRLKHRFGWSLASDQSLATTAPSPKSIIEPEENPLRRQTLMPPVTVVLTPVVPAVVSVQELATRGLWFRNRARTARPGETGLAPTNILFHYGNGIFGILFILRGRGAPLAQGREDSSPQYPAGSAGRPWQAQEAADQDQ